MNAGIVRHALPASVERELPAVARAYPKPAFFRPSLAKIRSTVRTITVNGIACATSLHDSALLSLLNLLQPGAQPVHILRFHQQEPLDQGLIDVGLAI